MRTKNNLGITVTIYTLIRPTGESKSYFYTAYSVYLDRNIHSTHKRLHILYIKIHDRLRRIYAIFGETTRIIF